MNDFIVWGGLAKAQDDPETIEEAIARMIDEHKDDTDAHAEEGQSLTLHRANEVVDHPEGSVLADKESFTETIFKTSFEAIDAWQQWGYVALLDLGNVRILAEEGTWDYSHIHTLLDVEGDFADPNRDSMFQANLKLFYNGVSKFFWGPLTKAYPGAYYGYGFQYENNQLRGGIFHQASGYITLPIDVDVTKYHVYRAQIHAEEKEVRFFVDGVLKATISNIDEINFNYTRCDFYSNAIGSGVEATMFVNTCTCATKP